MFGEPTKDRITVSVVSFFSHKDFLKSRFKFSTKLRGRHRDFPFITYRPYPPPEVFIFNYSWLLSPFLAPLLYYLFFCHIFLDRNLKVFKRNFQRQVKERGANMRLGDFVLTMSLNSLWPVCITYIIYS